MRDWGSDDDKAWVQIPKVAEGVVSVPAHTELKLQMLVKSHPPWPDPSVWQRGLRRIGIRVPSPKEDELRSRLADLPDGLQVLDIARLRLGDREREALKAHPGLEVLTDYSALKANPPPKEPEHILHYDIPQNLAELKSSPGVRNLTIRWSDTIGEFLGDICEMQSLESLTFLYCDWKSGNPRDLEALPELKRLRFVRGDCPPPSLLTGLTSLEEISFENSLLDVDETELIELKKALPNCTIHFRRYPNY